MRRAGLRHRELSVRWVRPVRPVVRSPAPRPVEPARPRPGDAERPASSERARDPPPPDRVVPVRRAPEPPPLAPAAGSRAGAPRAAVASRPSSLPCPGGATAPSGRFSGHRKSVRGAIPGDAPGAGSRRAPQDRRPRVPSTTLPRRPGRARLDAAPSIPPRRGQAHGRDSEIHRANGTATASPAVDALRPGGHEHLAGGEDVEGDHPGLLRHEQPRHPASKNDKIPSSRSSEGIQSIRNPGGDLLSQGASPQVPSARAGLTAVFGMGTGVSPPLWPPETVRSADSHCAARRTGEQSEITPVAASPQPLSVPKRARAN